jgi:uncharacterized protein YbjT (DUF2867 family)
LRILITGANGHLGIRLINALSRAHDVVAVVRSIKALEAIQNLQCHALVVDYADVEGLATAAGDCDVVVHLVGIIKKSRNNTYDQAHEIPCAALALAAEKAGVERIIALSILGSHIDSENECLASRGRSDAILLGSTTPALIMRVPMVLGEGDYASSALFKKAGSRIAFGFRNLSLEQPIYAGDVINAIIAAVEMPAVNEVITLAGPEVLTRAELIRRAGRVIGNDPVTISIPVMFGRLVGRILESLLQYPPVTADMIDLLDHDDEVDSDESASRIGISLTSLDEMLKKIAVL